jgi:hypothetical protein
MVVFQCALAGRRGGARKGGSGGIGEYSSCGGQALGHGTEEEVGVTFY